jgi:hypothetical protein
MLQYANQISKLRMMPRFAGKTCTVSTGRNNLDKITYCICVQENLVVVIYNSLDNKAIIWKNPNKF